MQEVNPYAPPVADLSAEAPVAPQQNITTLLFSFTGRATRAQYWLFGMLPMYGLAFLFGMVSAITDVEAVTALYILWLWPALAISVKRWHDRGKSGMWVFINLIPIIGPLWALIEQGFLVGEPGSNQYGPDLLGRESTWERMANQA